jgi:hypothetical protein
MFIYNSYNIISVSFECNITITFILFLFFSKDGYYVKSLYRHVYNDFVALKVMDNTDVSILLKKSRRETLNNPWLTNWQLF